MNTFGSNLNLNTNHPIQASAQEFLNYKKYISIHSEDRDIVKFPTSNMFEIELPEDLLNVSSVRLVNWTFPSNYNTFSQLNSNITMTFKINNPYNPQQNNYDNDLLTAIYNCLFLSQNDNFTINIEEGFYNPSQITTELTNKFNEVVSLRIKSYLTQNGLTNLLDEFNILGQYSNFIVVYNDVGQKIWFGNKADGFILTTSVQALESVFPINDKNICISSLPNFSNWGLPNQVGLNRNDSYSNSQSDFSPRFYYGDVTPGDNGFWLLPNAYPNCQVYYLECPNKINLMGPSYIYMETNLFNCIDETSPFNLNTFTQTTNETNGVVNSAFAKMAIPSTPISQWFDRDALPYKIFVPAAERIRRLKFKLRYHDGKPADLGVFDYSFMLEFTILQPHQLRKFNLLK